MTNDSAIVEHGAVVVRRLLYSERDELAAHLARLSEHDRYLRFGAHLDDQALERYARRSDWLQRTVFGAFVGDQLRAAGECQILPVNWPREVELAFSVEAPLQGRGIGTDLFGRMLRFARNRGVRRAYLTTLRHNRPMRSIARKFDMRLESCEDEVEGRLELVGPSPASLWEEMRLETRAWFWGAWQQLLLRKARPTWRAY